MVQHGKDFWRQNSNLPAAACHRCCFDDGVVGLGPGVPGEATKELEAAAAATVTAEVGWSAEKWGGKYNDRRQEVEGNSPRTKDYSQYDT